MLAYVARMMWVWCGGELDRKVFGRMHGTSHVWHFYFLILISQMKTLTQLPFRRASRPPLPPETSSKHSICCTSTLYKFSSQRNINRKWPCAQVYPASIPSWFVALVFQFLSFFYFPFRVDDFFPNFHQIIFLCQNPQFFFIFIFSLISSIMVCVRVLCVVRSAFIYCVFGWMISRITCRETIIILT